MADLAATFRKPFAEQVAAFLLRLSNPVPTSRWDDISHEAHNSSFMVAGAIKADLLGRIVYLLVILLTIGVFVWKYGPRRADVYRLDPGPPGANHLPWIKDRR